MIITVIPRNNTGVFEPHRSSTLIVANVPTHLQGPQGLSGIGILLPIRIAGEALSAGQPVYTDLIDGKVYLATATIPAKARVAGIANVAAAIGVAVALQIIELTLTDWTPVTGAVSLLPGQNYFLGTTAGTLTTTAPTGVGQSLTVIGMAMEPQTLVIRINPPILL